MAPQDTAMEPRPNPRWPRGTCFAWELLRGCRKGPMLDGTGPLLCIEVEEPGGPHESGGNGVQFQPVPPWELRKRR
jgi:hypothetical protein